MKKTKWFTCGVGKMDKMLLLMLLLSSTDDWLLQNSAKPLPLDTDKTVIVCSPSNGCETVIVID